jgi:hypothetical protein
MVEPEAREERPSDRWLVIVDVVDVPSASEAFTLFVPFTSPLCSPSNWPFGRSANSPVTSEPFKVTVTVDGSVPAGRPIDVSA